MPEEIPPRFSPPFSIHKIISQSRYTDSNSRLNNQFAKKLTARPSRSDLDCICYVHLDQFNMIKNRYKQQRGERYTGLIGEAYSIKDLSNYNIFPNFFIHFQTTK